MATIKHDLANTNANKAYVELTNNELETLKEALDQLTNRSHYYVKCCSECGHKVRKKTANDPTRPKITVTAIAKELGMSRQSIYMLINQPKVELMRFLQLQKILKCQILNEQDIDLYANYLKFLLIDQVVVDYDSNSQIKVNSGRGRAVDRIDKRLGKFSVQGEGV